jgi:hypothetical protein
MTQMTTPAAYSAADIETNRAGRLSDEQRRFLRSQARSFSRSLLTGAIVPVAIGVIVATSTGPAPNAWLRPVAAAGFFLAAILLVLVALRPNPETGDASAGRVNAVEGAVGKRSHTASSGGSSSTTYRLEIGEESYSVGIGMYQAAPDAGWLRLYVTPRSHKVVNFERLPDRAVPDPATLTPASMLGQFGTAFGSHDQQTRNEARAEMEATGRALEAQMGVSETPATPPAAGEGDPRPLAQAILGTWKMGPMSVTFMADGTMVATFMGGAQRQGHWSVGADGKLTADAAGSGAAADAWVAGDTLTISQKGGSAAFHRAN